MVVLAAFTAPACDGFPAAFTPSGERVQARILDARTLEADGRRIGWHDFVAGIRRQVVEAEQGKAPRPWVVVTIEPGPDPGADSKLVNRMLDDLWAAGVRSIDFGR